jgi:hypothetical protein
MEIIISKEVIVAGTLTLWRQDTRPRRVAQWLEQRCKDLMIFASRVRIPQWDMGASPTDKTHKPRSRITVCVARKRTRTAKNHECYLQPCHR